MKKKLAVFVSAIALLASAAASSGCVWLISDEPNTKMSFKD